MEEPSRSPLYEAQNAQRYERQLLIREYEESYSCRLAVVIDTFFSRSITLFEEVLYDADPEQPSTSYYPPPAATVRRPCG